MSGNLFIYYREGDPQAVVAPDVFVVVGADSADRSTYRLWDEPKGPDFLLEFTSRSTRHEDQVIKRELYRSLGVREYWQFDPTDDYLEPARCRGWNWWRGRIGRCRHASWPTARGCWRAAVLDLELRLSERGPALPRSAERTGPARTLPEAAEARQREESRLARLTEARQRETRRPPARDRRPQGG